MIRLLARKTRSLVAQPPFLWAWLVPVWLGLGLARAGILTVAFRRLAPLFGRDAGILVWIPCIEAPDAGRAALIHRTIAIAARYTPWTANCFPQAIVAMLLLRLYGVPAAMYFGVARDTESGGMKAHAWVSAGPVTVCGGASSFRSFSVVRTFIHPPAAIPTV